MGLIKWKDTGNKECVKKVRLLKRATNKELDEKKGFFIGDLFKLDKKGRVVKIK